MASRTRVCMDEAVCGMATSMHGANTPELRARRSRGIPPIAYCEDVALADMCAAAGTRAGRNARSQLCSAPPEPRLPRVKR
ncbi:hypothetical protein PCAR4_200094 [Paraburkholderia caribensis]|nr:hypothetical protein PCAR4_200094 [Paraburkholderia caribensis]